MPAIELVREYGRLALAGERAFSGLSEGDQCASASAHSSPVWTAGLKHAERTGTFKPDFHWESQKLVVLGLTMEAQRGTNQFAIIFVGMKDLELVNFALPTLGMRSTR